MNYIIENAEVKYPRIDKTYKFDTTENRSVPCDPLDDGATYSSQFILDKAQAKALQVAMVEAYAEKSATDDKWPKELPFPFKKTDDGRYEGKVTFKGAYGKEVTNKPKQYDGANKELPDDFQLTTGSTANFSVTLVPYNMATTGVSLRLRAVQVTKYVPMQAASPFDVVEDAYSGEGSPFSVATGAEKSITIAPVSADEVEAVEPEPVEAPISEPKKVVKLKSAAAPKGDTDLSAIVDGWDD